MKGNYLLVTLLFGAQILLAQPSRVLGLQECVDIALENNLTVKRSNLGLEGAKINYRETQATRLPNFNMNWSYGNNYGRSIDPTTNQFNNQKIGTSGLNGSSNVSLFSGFQIHNSIQQRNMDVDVATYNLLKSKNDVSLSIATFYLNVIFNKELVENARYQLESSQNQLDRTKKLVASGALPRTNELELISQVASSEVTLINAQNNLELSLLNLKQGMLIPATENIDIVVPEFSLTEEIEESVTSDDMYSIALGSQPEIKSADMNVESARLGVKVADGGKYPTLSLSGSFRTNYSNAFDERFIPDGTSSFVVNPALQTASGEAILVESQGFNTETIGFKDQYDENLSKSLGVNLSIPIFNRLSTSSNIQRSKIQLQQAEISAVEQRNTLRQLIETAYTNALAASKTYTASNRQVEALEETFRAIENQYNLGAANFTDYQVASNNLFQAKSDLTRAKFDYLFKMKVLDFYQGKELTF